MKLKYHITEGLFVKYGVLDSLGTLQGCRLRVRLEPLLRVSGLGLRDYLGIQKPTVLGVLPSNQGVITYYFVGFGATGRDWGLGIACFEL